MTRKDVIKLFVRFFIIFGLCCPIFIAIGVSLEDNFNGFWETMIYTVVGGLIFLLEEYVFWKQWKKRMVARSQTTPDKYFAEQRKIYMQKRHLTENYEQVINNKKRSKRNGK